MHKSNLLQNKNGFTLVEVLVTMAVFIIILMIAAESFKNIISISSRLTKSEESNIEGVVGLEILRHDLEQIGFGLPWGFCRPAPGTTDGSCANTDISYLEASDTTGDDLNDAPGGVPRALAAIDSPTGFLSDFIALKGTTVGRSLASQRWTYIPFNNISTSTGKESRPISWPSTNLKTSANNSGKPDRVSLIRSNFNVETDDHLLIVDPSDNQIFHINYNNTGGINDDYLPKSDIQSHMVYGLDDYSATSTPRMPFNRADFFVSSTSGTVPTFCAPLTGVLYKMTVNHADGSYLPIPLLDCVADMQVVLGWDTSDGGKANSIDAWSSVPNSSGNVVASGPSGAATKINGWLSSAKGVREHLKSVKVYVLAQEGKRDSNYNYPQSTMIVGNGATEQSLTNLYTFTADQLKYRWKLYRIIARPKNLLSNQR